MPVLLETRLRIEHRLPSAFEAIFKIIWVYVLVSNAANIYNGGIMPQGKVKWFDAKKGYGFIVSNDGKDVFVHFSDISSEESYKSLEEGAEVEFDLVEDKKGQKASNVKLVK